LCIQNDDEDDHSYLLIDYSITTKTVHLFLLSCGVIRTYTAVICYTVRTKIMSVTLCARGIDRNRNGRDQVDMWVYTEKKHRAQNINWIRTNQLSDYKGCKA